MCRISKYYNNKTSKKESKKKYNNIKIKNEIFSK